MSPKIKACLLVVLATAIASTMAAAALRWRERAGQHPPAALVLQDRSAAPPATLAFCRRAAELLHDVTWATVCETLGEDSVDCTLPDRAAADVNAIYRAEERRCLATEAQAGAVSAAPPSPRDEPTGRTARR